MAVQWLVSLIWMAGIIGVLITPRPEFYTLWSYYSLAFASYAWLILKEKPIAFTHGLMLAFVCRVISFFFDPQLSDDYFRFIWDGMVMHEGFNPAAHTPTALLKIIPINDVQQSLYALLNSKAYFSVYPPVTQLCFYLSYAVNHLNIDGHVIFFKALLLLCDAVIIFLLGVLLKKTNQPVDRLLLYGLNPLIVIEYCGNLHMDGLMIMGLLGAIVLSERRNLFPSALMMAFSLSSKLFSAIAMPFMPRSMYWKKIIVWSMITFLLVALLFLVFFRVHTGWIQSVALWFQSFEFNSSLYYLVREIHSSIKGYDNIQFIGPVMAILTMLMIGLIWLIYLRKKQMHWSNAMVIVLTIYLLMSTTVHPWYLGTLFTLSIISGHRYPLLWTYLVFLSYSHYQGGGFRENYLFIGMEYFLLFIWIGIEIRRK